MGGLLFAIFQKHILHGVNESQNRLLEHRSLHIATQLLVVLYDIPGL